MDDACTRQPGECLVSILWTIAVSGAPAVQSAETLGTDDKRLIVERIVQALRSSYVFPDRAEQMTAFIARGVTEGGYDSIADPQVLAESVTRDLRSTSSGASQVTDEFGPRARDLALVA